MRTRLTKSLERQGDLDFVATNRGVVARLPRKARPGVSGDIHTATLCIGGIAVDVSTLDGLNFEEDLTDRSCLFTNFFIRLHFIFLVWEGRAPHPKSGVEKSRMNSGASLGDERAREVGQK